MAPGISGPIGQNSLLEAAVCSIRRRLLQCALDHQVSSIRLPGSSFRPIYGNAGIIPRSSPMRTTLASGCASVHSSFTLCAPAKPASSTAEGSAYWRLDVVQDGAALHPEGCVSCFTERTSDAGFAGSCAGSSNAHPSSIQPSRILTSILPDICAVSGRSAMRAPHTPP